MPSSRLSMAQFIASTTSCLKEHLYISFDRLQKKNPCYLRCRLQLLFGQHEPSFHFIEAFSQSLDSFLQWLQRQHFVVDQKTIEGDEARLDVIAVFQQLHVELLTFGC